GAVRGAAAKLVDLAASRRRARAVRVGVEKLLVSGQRLPLVALLLVRLGDSPHRRLVARRDAERGPEPVVRARELFAIEMTVTEPGERLDAGRVAVDDPLEQRHRLAALAL